jgi:hypothetical protein
VLVVDEPVLVAGGGPVEVGDGDVGGGVEGTGVHAAETPATPTFTGSEIWDNGVPGGTFTTNDSFCPVRSVTASVHWSASAEGNAAIPITASTVAPVIPASAARFRSSSNMLSATRGELILRRVGAILGGAVDNVRIPTRELTPIAISQIGIGLRFAPDVVKLVQLPSAALAITRVEHTTGRFRSPSHHGQQCMAALAR